MTVSGSGQKIRNPGAAPAVHEFQIWLVTDTVLSTANNAAPFDAVLVDTDGYQSTTPFTFGVTVPIGAAAVIPAGLGGDYDFGGEAGFDMSPSASPWPTSFGCAVAFYKNNSDDSTGVANGFIPVAAESEGLSHSGFQLTILPKKITLAEGDVVWAFVQNQTSTLTDITLLSFATSLILRKRS